MPFAENLGNTGSALDAQFGSSPSLNSNMPTQISHDGTNFVYMPGESGNMVSFPHRPELAITGDIDIRAYLALDNWTPNLPNPTVIGKFGDVGERSYRLAIQSDSSILFEWSSTGVIMQSVQSAPLPVTDGDWIGIRVTMDVNDGNNKYDCRFYISTDFVTWVPHPNSNLFPPGVATSFFRSNAPVEIGSSVNGTGNLLVGKVQRAQIRDGINGPVVLDVDFTTAVTTGAEIAVPVSGEVVAAGVERLNFGYVSNLGSLGLEAPARLGSATGADSNDPLWLSHSGESALVLPGTSGNYATVPDNNALDITGDIDIRVDLAMAVWTPSAAFGQGIISKTTLGDPNRSWYLNVEQNGRLRFYWYPAGTGASQLLATSTVSPTVSDGGRLWVRATLDVNNGSGGYTTSFFTSVDGVTWAPLGTPVVTTSGTTSIAAGAGPIYIGNNTSGATGSQLSARIYRAQVRNGINGTIVFDTDFSVLKAGAQAAPITGSIANDLTSASYVSNLGWAGEVLAAKSGSTAGADSNDPTYLTHDGTNHLYLPGVNNNHAWIPSAIGSSTDITGDIDVRVRVAMDNWTLTNTFASKGYGSAWYFYADATNIYFSFTSGGTIRYPFVSWSSRPATSEPFWVRATRVASTGVITFYSATDSSSVPTVWTAVGSTTSASGAIDSSNQAVGVGAAAQNTPSGSVVATGKFYRAQLWNGVEGSGGTVVFDADFTTGITSGGQTSFTATTGQTVTINRSTSGKKAVAVVRPTWLFGTDDYLEVADNDLLDFGASDSFTVMACGRFWNAQGTNDTLVAKKANTTNTTQGWSLSNGSSTALNGQAQIGDGSAGITATSASRTAGTLTTIAAVRNVAADNVTVYTGGTAGTPVTDTTTTLANSEAMRIGRLSGAGTEYADMELFAVAIWRRALSAAEITLVNDFYQTGANAAAAESLLAEGVFWIDAARSKPMTGIVKSVAYPRTDVVTPNYLYLPGVAGNYAWTPDSAALDITGDIDIRVDLAMEDWTPATTVIGVIGKTALIDPNRTWALWVQTSGQLRFWWNPLGTNASAIFVDSTVAPSVTDGSRLWIRATLDVDNGSGGYTVTFYTSSDGTTWNVLGTPVSTTSGTTSIAATTAPINIGSYITGAAGSDLAGKVYRAQIRNGIGGTVVFDADFSSSLTSGSQTSFTEAANGATVTINRSSSGRKAVAVVDRPVFLFGSDDYIEVLDHPALNFGATDSFTVLAAVRQWGTPTSFGRYIDKRQTTELKGWGLNTSGTALTLVGAIDAGATDQATTTSITAGTLAPLGMVIDRTNQTLAVFNGSTLSATVSTSSVGSIESTAPVRIGSLGAGGNYQDFEFYSAAVWRRALTQAEITTLSNYYQYGINTTEAETLLNTSVFWIDAEQSNPLAAINRTATGKKTVACVKCTYLLGADDFFEIPSHPGFNLTAEETGTWLILIRRHRTQAAGAAMFTKTATTTPGSTGWAITNSTGSDPMQTQTRLGNSTNTTTVNAPTVQYGYEEAYVAVRDTNTVTIWTNTVEGPAVVDLTGDLSNTFPVRIGRLSSTGTNYLDAEIRAAAFWRRALSDSEIQTVLNYYGV